MALNLPLIEQQCDQLITSTKDLPPDEARQLFAKQLSQIIVDAIKSATVTVAAGIPVSTSAGAGTTTGTGTGTLN